MVRVRGQVLQKLISALSFAAALASTAAQATEVRPGRHAWADTEIAWGLFANPRPSSERTDLSTQPWLGHRLTLRPRLEPASFLQIGAEVAIEQALVDPEEYRHSTLSSAHDLYLTDLLVDVSTPGATEPLSGIRASGGLYVLAPTSSASREATLLAAPALGLALSRDLPLLAGLTLAYQGRFDLTFYKYTTLSRASVGYPWSGGDTGVRTSWAAYEHGPRLTFRPIPILALEASVSFLTVLLHGLSGDLPASSDGTNARTEIVYRVALACAARDWLTVRLGVANEVSRPLPEATMAEVYRERVEHSNANPQIFLELGFFFDALLSTPAKGAGEGRHLP